ncbi:MAG: UDP-N-acetylmuramoyl-L-alanine--D-glutamate ligase [Gordonibacter sp.]|uniref:UDP-N-acetylmuramoyl-L-alanine--D-glutamate ligase n=1 Tax=Gordonibacter sp. TaxID=1968902 RepID=UPI002FCC7030
MGAAAMIPGRKRAPESLGRVLVLGLGKSGRAAVEYCLGQLGGRVDALAVAAGEPTESAHAFAAAIAERGATVAFGEGAVGELAAGALDGRFDLCIPSPGIPPFSPLYVGALEVCDELVSEVEFAWRESDADSRWVAVTGTNGKTTVASLAAHVLRADGRRAAAVGNIGDTCIEAVVSGRVDTYVAEVSSYQLASTSAFAPDVAVLLNITPDHLHWHGTFEAYCAAKCKVLENLATVAGATAVLDATNDIVRAEVRRLRALAPEERGFAYVPLGTYAGLAGDMRMRCGSDNAAFLGWDGLLRIALGGCEHALVRADELRIEGEHNVSNALAAAAAALALGADGVRVAHGLRTFEPLEHRIEPCGTVGGVSCYNDSKATNVDATLKALSSFPGKRVLVLLGGDDKGTDLAPLVEAARIAASVAVCFGSAGERFAAAFEAPAACHPSEAADAAETLADVGGLASDSFLVVRASHLEDAFDAALRVAQPGDVLLLSPACASFDEFGSFEQRGRAFKALVADRAARAGA